MISFSQFYSESTESFTPVQQHRISETLKRIKSGIIIGNIELSNINLKHLPNLSRVKVTGYFNCSNNQLTSLTGAPQQLGGDFLCSNNQLTSLTGAPQNVGGDFCCSNNQLTSLTGAPQQLGGDFLCFSPKIFTKKDLEEYNQLRAKGVSDEDSQGVMDI